MSLPQANLQPTPAPEKRQKVNIVVVGHVDHGKSTIVGRLLVDTHSLPEGKLAQVKVLCERNAKPFEYAFVIDALKNEQAQGITIDAARVFFSTPSRDYILIDAPGHIEFLKNMVTGASRAEAALLVIDAQEGVQQNSRRHGYLLSMLGIQQVAVLVNKMDRVGYAKAEFDRIVAEYRKFLEEIGVTPVHFIPVSGINGDNLASRSQQTPWYQGPSVLDTLDSFRAAEPAVHQPLRFFVQDVYKFTRSGDDRRIIAGEIASGRLRVGDHVVFYPSGKSAKVRSIEGFNMPARLEVAAGSSAVGFTVEEQIYVTRGEVATLSDERRPEVSTRMRVKLFWLGKKPFKPKQEYLLRLGTSKARMELEEVVRVLDASTLETTKKGWVERHEVADCLLRLKKSMAFDVLSVTPETGRFVIVDGYRICGGGIVQERLDDHQAEIREKVFLRNFKWERSDISPELRSEVYNQKPALLLITGSPDSERKILAKALEKRLFSEGKIVYYLGMGSFLYGVDADEKGHGEEAKMGHIRRLAEVANILLDAGVVLIVTARELSAEDLETMKTVVYSDYVHVVWVGDSVTTDIPFDLQLPSDLDTERGIEEIKTFLQSSGVIFRPNW